MGLYRFPKKKPFEWSPSPQRTSKPSEPAAYSVQGKRASALEWAFARALDQRQRSYIYEYEITTGWQIPGQENKIDFVVDGNRPFEIDGEIAHKHPDDKAKDKARDAVIDDMMTRRGWEQIVRIDASTWRESNAEEKAQQAVEEYI